MYEWNEVMRWNMKLESIYHINETFLYQVSRSVPAGIQTRGLWVLSRAEVPPTASWTTSIAYHAPLCISHTHKKRTLQWAISLTFLWVHSDDVLRWRISFRKCNNVSKSLSKTKIRHDEGPLRGGGGDRGEHHLVRASHLDSWRYHQTRLCLQIIC
jgi:hypothetical protein